MISIIFYEKEQNYILSLGYNDQYLSVDDLPRQLTVENEVIYVQSLQNLSHIQFDNNNASVLRAALSSSSFDKGHGMVCIISGISFSIIWGNPQVYLFDPHSRSNCGQITESGTSVLLKFDSLNKVENHIKEIYVPPGQGRCLETQCFKIVTSDQIISNIRLSIRRKRKLDKDRKYRSSETGRAKKRECDAKYKASE